MQYSYLSTSRSRFYPLTFWIASLFIIGCENKPLEKSIRGSGTLTSEERKVPNFNNVKIGGGSGVVKDVEDNQVIMGYPAVSFKEFIKNWKK